MSKSEVLGRSDPPVSTLLSSSNLSSVQAGTPASPGVAARKSPRPFSRTSNFFNSTLLRPRGHSVAGSSRDDWGRPVGGSEGLGTIYPSAMDFRERNQVLRSVTTLTKRGDQDLTGQVAEAAPDDVLPFPTFNQAQADLTNGGLAPELPPSYQLHGVNARRGSEGSLFSRRSNHFDGTNSASDERSRMPSYFARNQSEIALATASPCSPPQQKRRMSAQLSLFARQTFSPTRSFVGSSNGSAPNGVSETSSAVSPEQQPEDITERRADNSIAIPSPPELQNRLSTTTSRASVGGSSGHHQEVGVQSDVDGSNSYQDDRRGSIGNKNQNENPNNSRVNVNSNLESAGAKPVSLGKQVPKNGRRFSISGFLSREDFDKSMRAKQQEEQQRHRRPSWIKPSSHAGAASSSSSSATSAFHSSTRNVAAIASSSSSSSSSSASLATPAFTPASASASASVSVSASTSSITSPSRSSLPLSSALGSALDSVLPSASAKGAVLATASSSPVLSRESSSSHTFASPSESSSNTTTNASNTSTSTAVTTPSEISPPCQQQSTATERISEPKPFSADARSSSPAPGSSDLGRASNLSDTSPGNTSVPCEYQQSTTLIKPTHSGCPSDQLKCFIDTPIDPSPAPVVFGSTPSLQSRRGSAISSRLLTASVLDPICSAEEDRLESPSTPPASTGSYLSPRSSVGTPPDRALDGPAARLVKSTAEDHGLPSDCFGSSPYDHKTHGRAPNVNATESPTPIFGTRASADPPARVSFDLMAAAAAVDLPPGTRLPASNIPDSTNFSRVSLEALPARSVIRAPTRTSMASDRSRSTPFPTDSPVEPVATSASGGSRFFSRFSLGGSRRGSAETTSASPETKPQSRFKSFGRMGGGISNGRPPPSSSKGLMGLKQRWASASTDMLALGSSDTQGRSSMSVARDEATRPRKSLHLPRSTAEMGDEDAVVIGTDDQVAAPETLNMPSASNPNDLSTPTATRNSLSVQRPSFSFLRKPSGTDSPVPHSSDAWPTEGGRRGSKGARFQFAQNFVNKALHRNSKLPDKVAQTEDSVDPATTSAAPAFRNGIFDRTDDHATHATYPGLSSTVNWGAPPAALPASPSADSVAPGDVDPPHVASNPIASDDVIPVAHARPKAVAEIVSSVLPERRPSLGIDEEQNAIEAAQTPGLNGDATPTQIGALTDVSLNSDSVPVTQSSNGQSSSTDSNTNRRSSSRSSRALSHLPRLNSMRAIGSGGGNGSGSGGGRDGSDGSGQSGNGNVPEALSEDEQEASEDEEDGDETGHTSDYHDADETETDEETDHESNDSPIASRRVAAASTPMSFSGSGGINRNRPAESIVLPPAPTFIPSESSTSGMAQGTALQTNGSSERDLRQAVGRDSWTSFSMNGFSPFQTPTPTVSGGASASSTFGFSGPTPRAARQEQSESSYFAARPGSSSTKPITAGAMSGVAPPPSPSIISRSRAPSSASSRTMRMPIATPGASSTTSGPVPHRSMPQPSGNLPPMDLSRQISFVSGISQPGVARSKSPASGSIDISRSSTPGTLTPQQALSVNDRTPTRGSSIERPASSADSKPADLVASGPVNGVGAAAATPVAAPVQAAPLDPIAKPSTPGNRPNFYQQKSKSLIDLLGPASRRMDLDGAVATPLKIEEGTPGEPLRTPRTPQFPASEVPPYQKKDGLTPINAGLKAPAGLVSPGVSSLSRRRSMFEMRAEPPPYSIIHNRPEGPQIILPREEEGKERLPGYCCGVHIEGYLPRKMEFSSPGVQAKDRSWKRQYFVLHGTSLRVYRNDLSVDRYAASGSWGEMKGVHVHLEPMNEDGSSGGGSSIGLGAAAREAISHTPLGSRHDSSKGKEGATVFDAKNGLIRNYTLQGAESGLAADYLKRRHVVRVRAEGEQFLLQTRSDRHVVDWIEALQAATNVAMDLEKRPMPKFITLPRRRRRRRRNADGTTLTAEEQEARDLAEAQRRSVAETGASGAASSNNTTSRGASAQPDATPRPSISQSARPSMSLENELDPSAAFEEMLREDQDEIRRRSAADI